MDAIADDLIQWNLEAIEKLETISREYQNEETDYLQTRGACFDKLSRLSYSWCGLPFGNYADVYFETLEAPPLGSEYDVEWGSLRPQHGDWILLNQEIKDNFIALLPSDEIIKNKTDDKIEALQPLISEIIDKNSIIRHYIGLESEYSNICEQNEKWGYTPEFMIDKYRPKQGITRDNKIVQSGYNPPYHSRLMAYYDAIYLTVNLIVNKSKNTIRILKRINANLPISKMRMERDEIGRGQPSNDFSGATIGTFVNGNENNLTKLSSYANSGKMELHVENSSQVAELLKTFLTQIENTTELKEYQKEDVAHDILKVIEEFNKPVDSQDEGLIKYSFTKIWNVTKDVALIAGSFTSIMATAGITL